MKLLDTLTVHHGADPRAIELYHGDLADMAPEDAVDLLVVSAFPDSYFPTRSSLIGALHSKGVSVAELARDKAFDLRQHFSCWLSHEIPPPRRAGIEFKRLLCFEPWIRGEPPEVVGDIFRCLAPFLGDNPPLCTVAMPLVSSGNGGMDPAVMFTPLLEAAVHWMALGLPLRRLKIVERFEAKAQELREQFTRFKEEHAGPTLVAGPGCQHDVFISYSHADQAKVALFVAELRKRRPELRIFQDQLSLTPGAAWQQALFDAIENCAHFVCFYSPAYLSSKVCMEEFHLARLCHRELGRTVPFPIYLYSAALPPHLRLVQYVDCREGDEARLRQVCNPLLDRIERSR